MNILAIEVTFFLIAPAIKPGAKEPKPKPMLNTDGNSDFPPSVKYSFK